MNSKKKYLTIPRKFAYGSGDFGSNAFYSFVGSFIMIYLTNTMGLDSGIIGTLMLVSKILDGITDVILGNMIDRTHTKMGKARPWILGSSFALLILQILLFSMPADTSDTMQYAYFFIVYTAANAFAYTANNIAYATLSMLITNNSDERVQLGTFRFAFAMLGGTVVAAVSMGLVDAFGGGVGGWRMTALVMAIVQVVCNLIVVLGSKEIQDKEALDTTEKTDLDTRENISLRTKVMCMIKNKYYILLLIPYMVFTMGATMFQTMGVYYCTYVLHNAALLGLFSISASLMIVGLLVNPFLVAKWGMHKVIVYTTALSALFSPLAVPFGVKGIIFPTFIFVALKWICTAGFSGCLNALIAEVATYQKNRDGISIEGMIFSCSSVGQKIGSGVAIALSGWLLSWGKYNGALEEQASSAINMINFGYFIIPVIAYGLAALMISKNTVCEENQKYADIELHR